MEIYVVIGIGTLTGASLGKTKGGGTANLKMFSGPFLSSEGGELRGDI